MSRISELFARKNNRVLNVYCTAGYPQSNSTVAVIKALQQYGADLVEIGMPYSDPLADGPVIQQSNATALANGMTMELLFEQLKSATGIDVPLVLMGYMNPVLQYGFERFCRAAKEAGVDGLILPDLPPYEFEQQYRAVLEEVGLDFIFLVTPETPDARVQYLDSLSSGFLYAVSSSSTTGKDKPMASVKEYLARLKSLNLKNPLLVGFGVKDKSSFDAVCEQANGAIIGSAYIRALQGGDQVVEQTRTFLDSILH